MRALKARWTPTSRLYDRADEGQPRKFILDCGIAWQNYLDGNGMFQEINLTPQPSDIAGYNWTVPGLPFKPYLAANGARRIFVDRNSQAKRIDFPASKFLANKTFTKVGNSLVWSSNAYNVVMRWENSRIKFDVIVKRNIPFDQVQFDVDKTGLSDAELLAFMTNLKATDSSPEPIIRPLSVSLVAGVLTLGFDLTEMTFPVTIDPTLDLQVGANADDMYEWEPNGNTLDAILFDSNSTTSRAWPGLRWVDNSISQSDTMDVAYISLYLFNNTVDDVNGNLHFQLAAAPVTFTAGEGNNNITGRSRTTASASWIANGLAPSPPVWVNSPSIVTPLQEVVDSYSPTAFVVIGRPNTDVYKSLQCRDYNYDTTLAPKLHIEYTAGGADAVPQAWAQYRARRV